MGQSEKTNFLFWNINRNRKKETQLPIEPVLAKLARIHDLDVLMLAETDLLDARGLLGSLKDRTGSCFQQLLVKCKKVKVFVRQEPKIPPRFREVFEEDRFSGISWVGPLGRKRLLVVAHLPDQYNHKPDDLRNYAFEWLTAIRRGETNHSAGTIFVGDLNLNPFSSLLTDPFLFNSVSSKELAMKGFRRYQKKKYPFFYNPMWNLLGDRGGPPGTYYLKRPKAGEIHWNMLDQLLMRPNMVEFFDEERLRILTNVNGLSLVNRANQPNERIYSDHLPLHFSFTLK